MIAKAFDVFIVGGGPAGAATAISLQAVAPDLTVCIADMGRDGLFRVGESVPPLIKPFLEHLGVWQAFLRDRHCQSFRTVSAWGSPELISNEFFLSAHNTGWRLDRNRFDAMLLGKAKQQGTTILNAKTSSVYHDSGQWRIDCGESGIYTARCVVDATGRSALVSRLAGIKPVNYDQLVASTVFFEDRASPNVTGADAALIESFQQGWWYTAATPGNRRVVALMTDADIAHHLRANRLETWLACLAKTTHIKTVLCNSQPLGPPKLWPASSRLLQGIGPQSLIAVGDAYSRFDPLSSQGIIKALRSAIFGSYALADWMLRSDSSGFSRYEALMQREFASYRNTLRNFYREEMRWPDSPFWQRRHGQS